MTSTDSLAVLRVSAALLCCVLYSGTDAAEREPQFVALEDGRQYENLNDRIASVRTPYLDITTDARPEGWDFELSVDVSGRVVSARCVSGPDSQQDGAIRIARSLTFKPFEVNGQRVAVRFPIFIPAEPADYRGPVQRTPATDDYEDFSIVLRRTSCFGDCPDYRVEVRADGTVTYEGRSSVLVHGKYQWRVPLDAVTNVIELVRRARFFELDGYYVLQATDLPTYVTRVHAGPREKFVLNYGAGTIAAGVVASTSYGGPAPNMPPVVSELEDAVDLAAQTVSWVRGDETTIRKLEAAQWNFRSKASGRALSFLVANCETSLAMEFVRRGAPVREKVDGWSGRADPATATRCGSTLLVQRLIEAGGLPTTKARREFLLASSRSGYPEMVSIAVRHHPNVAVKDEEGTPLITVAAAADERPDDESSDPRRDPVAVVKMLIANGASPNARSADGTTALFAASAGTVVRALIDAGADPNARDRERNTALFEARDAEAVDALIAAGADPNARNRDARTPLFEPIFAEPKFALLRAGADARAVDRFGRTPLFGQYSADAVRAMIAAGADVNHISNDGQTALTMALQEDVTIALMDAGASLPDDPTSLQSLVTKARNRDWPRLLPAFEAAASAAARR